jgi:hypothetical protein
MKACLMKGSHAFHQTRIPSNPHSIKPAFHQTRIPSNRIPSNPHSIKPAFHQTRFPSNALSIKHAFILHPS